MEKYEAPLVHVRPGFPLENEKTILVDLGRFGLPGQVEEVWCEDIGDGSARVASIPFGINGVALFDVLSLESSVDGHAAPVGGRSGRGVMRILIDPSMEKGIADSIAEKISNSLIGESLAHEWNGDRFVAVDIPSVSLSQNILKMVDSTGGVYWEWGAECGI
ncbi:DUF4265 domain-containing protein [Nocardiopsis dassonvillei]|uniref:DUF4265 domain-containing protein n=1 Tax=Nocardiopsis dassonvillei TaxID=2014 RepID=UPI0013EF0834|nr:DUF4265 domain-containing protein [Nocardiopsis dassonvillei]MCP3017208.1 DUF4265 domain-containing protein [Nocardiopsis dassonvillei]